MPNPLFFRYTYIISGKGYGKGKKTFFNVQGTYFGFWRSDRHRVDRVISEVRDFAFEIIEGLGNVQIFREGEDESQFTPRKGIRLYWKTISVNEVIVHSEDIKY